jgi:hypothetical protein
MLLMAESKPRSAPQNKILQEENGTNGLKSTENRSKCELTDHFWGKLK